MLKKLLTKLAFFKWDMKVKVEIALNTSYHDIFLGILGTNVAHCSALRALLLGPEVT
jgi:hypothetical protein